MACEMTLSNVLGKNKKKSNKKDSHIAATIDNSKPSLTPPTTRGGLRVYKIVVLGDGGVGKSGKCL